MDTLNEVSIQLRNLSNVQCTDSGHFVQTVHPGFLYGLTGSFKFSDSVLCSLYTIELIQIGGFKLVYSVL